MYIYKYLYVYSNIFGLLKKKFWYKVQVLLCFVCMSTTRLKRELRTQIKMQVLHSQTVRRLQRKYVCCIFNAGPEGGRGISERHTHVDLGIQAL